MFQSLQIRVPGVLELAACISAKDVANLQAPAEDKIIGIEGLAIYIPGPVLRNVIIESALKDPFKLIPILSQAAKAFNQENTGAKAVEHADNLCAWLYSVKARLITETRYSVDPDDAELKAFGIERASQCITLNAATVTRPREAVMLDGAMVISQLTNALTIQNEYLGNANVINRKNQVIAEQQEEQKKDRLKKLHLSIRTMLKMAAAMDSHNKDNEIAPSCLHFINSKNAGMAQFELFHQFKALKIEDLGFAAGTVQALYLGEFLYADSSTPSNFTVFCFLRARTKCNNPEDGLPCLPFDSRARSEEVAGRDKSIFKANRPRTT